jgi:hypothetical protein
VSWRRWKLGIAVALALSFFVAGAGLTQGMKWQAFVAVLCAACVTHFGSFLKDHPVEQITYDTETKTKDQTNKE